MCARAGGVGGRQILKSARMLPFEMRSETVIALLPVSLLSLCIICMGIERASISNGIISVGGMEERVADRF